MANSAAVDRRLRVIVEETRTKSFASAVDWPGWARSGKTAEAAVEGLLDSTDRYARIVATADAPFSLDPVADVVERVPGSATTTFGAPDAQAAADHAPLEGRELDRWIAVIQASWNALDQAASLAPGELVKGPRGGGRDRDEIVRHVCEAERSYGPKLGIRLPVLPKTLPIPAAAIAEQRRLVVEGIRATALRSGGIVIGDGPRAKPWPLRYGLRRLAWHVVDHAWELEDKTP